MHASCIKRFKHPKGIHLIIDHDLRKVQTVSHFLYEGSEILACAEISFQFLIKELEAPFHQFLCGLQVPNFQFTQFYNIILEISIIVPIQNQQIIIFQRHRILLAYIHPHQVCDPSVVIFDINIGLYHPFDILNSSQDEQDDSRESLLPINYKNFLVIACLQHKIAHIVFLFFLNHRLNILPQIIPLFRIPRVVTLKLRNNKTTVVTDDRTKITSSCILYSPHPVILISSTLNAKVLHFKRNTKILTDFNSK